MTGDDQARLDLAYRAWKAAALPDQQVEAGARRVADALTRKAPRRRSRKVISIGAGAVALSAALAYAASGPLASRFTRDKAAPDPRAAPQTLDRVGTLPTPPPKTLSRVVQDSEAAHARVLPVPAPEPSAARPTMEQKGRSRSVAESSWRRVDEALARGDHSGARVALEQLETRAKDEDTRAKSRLGLAQLALARGDCDEARRFARAVLALSGADAKHHQRARDVAARCAKDGG